MTFEFSLHIFKKYTNIKFNENPFIKSRFVSFARTDRCRWSERHEEANSRLSQFCETRLKIIKELQSDWRKTGLFASWNMKYLKMEGAIMTLRTKYSLWLPSRLSPSRTLHTRSHRLAHQHYAFPPTFLLSTIRRSLLLPLSGFHMWHIPYVHLLWTSGTWQYIHTDDVKFRVSKSLYIIWWRKQFQHGCSVVCVRL